MNLQNVRFVLYPPRIGCDEVQRLKNRFKERGFHCFIAKRDGVYDPQENDLIIGWGYSRPPYWKQKAEALGTKWLNHHSLIPNSVKKLTSFELLQSAGVPIPSWTTSKWKAQQWLTSGAIIFARTSQDGCKGEGISVIKPGEELPDALFYTVFIPSTREYRVYVVNGTVVDILEKRPIPGETPHEYIKGSEAMGWQFCRQGVWVPQHTKDVSTAAVAALGLDFGGVDVLVSGSSTTVLEVNTAPDIFGTGLDRFVDAFTNLAKAA